MPQLKPWAVLLTLALAGCGMSHYSLQSEQQFSTAPDLTEACRFQWNIETTLELTRKEWDRSDFTLPLEKMLSLCDDKGEITSGNGVIRGYYLSYYKFANRAAVVFPLQFLNAITFGHMPFSLTDHHVVCLEIRTTSLTRSSLTRGKVNWTGNIAANRKERIDERNAQARILFQDLSLQAWHKVWAPSSSLLGSGDCRTQLTLIAENES